VRGIVPLYDLDSELPQVIHVLRIDVASRDGDSAPHEQLGERAHSCAGDAYKVNWARIAGVEKHAVNIVFSAAALRAADLVLGRAYGADDRCTSAIMRLAMSSAACGRARTAAASRNADNRPGSLNKPLMVWPSRTPVS